MVECSIGNLGEELNGGNVIRVLLANNGLCLRNGGKFVLEMLWFKGVDVEEAMARVWSSGIGFGEFFLSDFCV